METKTLSFEARWRPSTLADLRGQDETVEGLRAFLANPEPKAFLFEGETGVGKTSAALAFARDLGIDVANFEFGGLYQIPSGEQTADSVRQIADQLRLCPMTGNGWKVCIVNECDSTSPQAAHVWLDVLENLPRRSVVIFTTNNAQKLPARFRDRCETYHFESSALILREAAEAFIAEVWKKETGRDDAPCINDLGIVEDGQISFRRIIARLAPFVRTGKAPARKAAPALAPAPSTVGLTPAQKAWVTRRAREQKEAS